MSFSKNILFTTSGISVVFALISLHKVTLDFNQADYQPEKDEDPRTGCRCATNRYHWQLWAGSCEPVHVPQVYNQQRHHLGHRNRQEDWESNNHICSPHHASVGELQALCQDKDDSLQYFQERDMDNICQEGEETEHFSLEVYPRHIVEGQSAQHWTEVLFHASLTTMFTLLRQHRLRWLGHVCHMEDGWIPKDIIYRELSNGKRDIGHPQLHNRDICKRNRKVLEIKADIAADHSRWRKTLTKQLMSGQ